MQPEVVLAFFAAKVCCWLMISLVFTRTPTSCFAELLSSSQCVLVHRAYSSSDARLCISLCWTLWGSCQPISPACWGPSGWKHNHLVYQSLLPDFYHLWTCWGCTPSQLSTSLSTCLTCTLSACLWHWYGTQCKSITDVKVDNIHCSPLIYQASHLIVEGYEFS